MTHMRCGLGWILLACAGCAALGQDGDKLQTHGFATQGVLYSSKNNYLVDRSSVGTADWTEAAMSLNYHPLEKVRVGAQAHYLEFGDIGSESVSVDWALADYKFREWLGLRAGKLKTPVGLFNDSQDVDAVYPWCLLPQSTYPIDNRAFLLSHTGGEVYGRQPLGAAGSVRYRAFGGESRLPLNEGYVRQIANASGLTFNNEPTNTLVGGDVRWATPWKPLLLGSSMVHVHLAGAATAGSADIGALVRVFYGQMEWGKYYAAAEHRHQPTTANYVIGTYPVQSVIYTQSWYAMAAYHATAKLQVGAYYSHYFETNRDTWMAANNSKDLTVSGRYDLNDYFYLKAETHFLHGEALGYSPQLNPQGLSPRTTVAVGKLGFTF